MNTEFNIQDFNPELIPSLQHKPDNKGNPVGSLGQLESLALQVGFIRTEKVN